MKHVDVLESRLCLSAVVTNGSLIITGTDASEVVRVQQRGGSYLVRDGSSAGVVTFSKTGIADVVVNAGGGDDTVRLDKLDVPVIVDAGAGNDRVWGGNVYVEERTVDVHIRRLRKALESFNYDRFIQTVRGSGYRFSTRSE